LYVGNNVNLDKGVAFPKGNPLTMYESGEDSVHRVTEWAKDVMFHVFMKYENIKFSKKLCNGVLHVTSKLKLLLLPSYFKSTNQGVQFKILHSLSSNKIFHMF
jgi:hypothetical protein